jgi:hypothetical protein
MNISRKDAIRFWSKIAVGSPLSCWIWTRGKLKTGYGAFHLLGTTGNVYAHRVAYELCFGKIPEGMDVCHSCDNPACCNPGHLWLGTHKDNMHDAFLKGRQRSDAKRSNARRGEAHAKARFTESQVRDIRRRAVTGKWGIQTQMAREYGVNVSVIQRIISGETWAHVKQ